jgi:hypothetical protein
LVSIEPDGSKNIFGKFFTYPELRKTDLKVAKLAAQQLETRCFLTARRFLAIERILEHISGFYRTRQCKNNFWLIFINDPELRKWTKK